MLRNLKRLRCLQVQDLHTLLEMYRTWQRQIYPYIPYDDFLLGCEKLSGTNILKVMSCLLLSLNKLGYPTA